jgi:hypothetical protein
VFPPFKHAIRYTHPVNYHRTGLSAPQYLPFYFFTQFTCNFAVASAKNKGTLRPEVIYPTLGQHALNHLCPLFLARLLGGVHLPFPAFCWVSRRRAVLAFLIFLSLWALFSAAVFALLWVSFLVSFLLVALLPLSVWVSCLLSWLLCLLGLLWLCLPLGWVFPL